MAVLSRGVDEPVTVPEWKRKPGQWAAIDCGLLRNFKVKVLRNPAQRLLYLASILHVADELTDGYISEEALPQLLLEAGCGNRSHVKYLVKAGLWIPDKHKGWWVRDYLDYNPPKTYWEARREANRTKQADLRERQRAERVTRYVTGDVPGDVTDITVRKSKSSLSIASPPTDSTATQPLKPAAQPVRPTDYGEPDMTGPTTLGGELEALMGRLKAGAE